LFRVQARNTVGLSAESSSLSVIAAKLPDTPLNLANNPSLTNAYRIGLSWQDGAYNGGSPIIDYQVSFAEETSD